MRRLSAAGATVAAVLGVLATAVASVSVDFIRYVSEAGIPGAAHSGLYRAGIWLIAAALALLVAPAYRTARLAAPAFALAAAAAAVSGAVSCSPGCPLPPFERPTAGDLVHAGASIAALLLCGWVMLVYAMKPLNSPLRRMGRLGVAVAGPLLGLAAFGLAFVGRGPFTGSIERAALLATSAWLIATAALHLRTKT